MGLFSWMKRGKPAPDAAAPVDPTPVDRTTAWLHDQITEHRQSGNAAALAEACATLSDHGSMAFGMVVSSKLSGRAHLRGEALAALRSMIADLPDNQCEHVFAVIERAKLPVDVSVRRAALEGSRVAARDRTARWIGEQIAERAEGDIVELAQACATLNGRGTMVFGMVMPAELATRPQLYEACLAAVRRRIPEMSAREAETVRDIATRANLPLEIADRRAELAAARLVEREAAVAAAAGSEPRNPDLEREIAANLDDDQSYLVLADWLQAQQHPRGELISLQVRAADDAALDRNIAAHLATHVEALLGPLASHQVTHDGMEREAFTWRRGFIHRACLSVDENVSDSDVALVDILEVLLAHPSGRYLAELTIGINGEGSDGPLDDVVAVLAREAPASLRTLHLGDVERDQVEMSWYQVGDVGPLWARVPQLRRLIVQGGSFELGTIELPNLEHAEFRTGGLSVASARAIATARWPRLEYLDVWYGDPNYGGDCTIDDLIPLLARTDLPQLVDLGLKNAAFTDEICRALGDSPLVAQLEELDLSMGTMSDDGAQLLVDTVAAFPRLTRLDVSRNYLSDEAIARLRAAFRTVVADAQDAADDPEDRYPSVGE